MKIDVSSGTRGRGVMPKARGRRGQAQVEYILLIGLIILFILIVLIDYREAVNRFICKVTIAIGGDPGNCGSAPPPVAAVPVPPPAAPPAPPAPNPSPPPSPAPDPSPTPPTGELSGDWCVYWGGTFEYRTTFTLLADGNYQSARNGIINLTNPDQFKINNAEGPFTRQPDGSFYDPRPSYNGVAFKRCP
ncbi:MAG: hypothetical protein ABI718_05410 [Acidobacteriota bacterium]